MDEGHEGIKFSSRLANIYCAADEKSAGPQASRSRQDLRRTQVEKIGREHRKIAERNARRPHIEARRCDLGSILHANRPLQVLLSSSHSPSPTSVVSLAFTIHMYEAVIDAKKCEDNASK